MLDVSRWGRYAPEILKKRAEHQVQAAPVQAAPQVAAQEVVGGDAADTGALEAAWRGVVREFALTGRFPDVSRYGGMGGKLREMRRSRQGELRAAWEAAAGERAQGQTAARARLERERAERERAERERAERARLQRERAERERAERERAEREQAEREQAEREQAERERQARLPRPLTSNEVQAFIRLHSRLREAESNTNRHNKWIWGVRDAPGCSRGSGPAEKRCSIGGSVFCRAESVPGRYSTAVDIMRVTLRVLRESRPPLHVVRSGPKAIPRSALPCSGVPMWEVEARLAALIKRAEAWMGRNPGASGGYISGSPGMGNRRAKLEAAEFTPEGYRRFVFAPPCPRGKVCAGRLVAVPGTPAGEFLQIWREFEDIKAEICMLNKKHHRGYVIRLPETVCR